MKTLTIKVTTEQASRYIRTANRAETLVADGYTFDEIGAEMVAVTKPGKLAASYFINLHTAECDCPDFTGNGSFCKHLIAYAAIQEEARMWEAICKEAEFRASEEN